MTVPYSEATSGAKAREETTVLLRRLGAQSVGWMDDFDASEVILAFTHRGRPVQMRASAKGWAALYLRQSPWHARRRCTDAEWRAKALRQGLIAVNSIIRDWVKGSVVAVECGMASFESLFLAHMLTNDGRPVIERITEAKLLPAPEPKP